jgi:hypothetical protein
MRPRLLVLVIILPLVGGCFTNHATGPLFQKVEPDPFNAEIYVYAPTGVHGIEINGVLKYRLDYGGYLRIVVPPEPVTISLYESSFPHKLEATAGQTYFLAIVCPAFNNDCWFKPMSETDALRDLKLYHLMEPPSKAECEGGFRGGLGYCLRTPKS